MDQIMPPRLTTLLNGSDLFLFTGGGCHVFAKALIHKLPDEHYQLALVIAESGGPAFHAVARSGDLVVDALGVRTEKNLLTLYSGYMKRRVELRTVTLEELFQPCMSQNDSPPKNKWGHHLDSEFVTKCLDKAYGVIDDLPDRYRVSVFKKGQKLIQP